MPEWVGDMERGDLGPEGVVDVSQNIGEPGDSLGNPSGWAEVEGTLLVQAVVHQDEPT